MQPATLKALFEVEVSVEVLSDFAAAEPLHPDEEALVQRAVEKRRREFAAGRTCARRALRAAGAGEVGALLSLPDRRVDWPRGYTGTISHAKGVAAAVVVPEARALGVGLDVEDLGRLKPSLYGQIAAEDEIAWIRSGPPGAEMARATQLFSAKEAFYKAQYPLTETFLGFHDVHYTARGNDGFEIELLRGVDALAARGGRFAGALHTDVSHVWAAVTIAR